MYDEYISLGSQCDPGLSLQKLNLKKITYPFDWIRSNSKIIYDVLINGNKKYLTFNTIKSLDYMTLDLDQIDFKNFSQNHINAYGQYFTHYNKLPISKIKYKFNNYFNSFYNLLNSNKKILFIHSHEEYIYHKKSRDNKNNFYNYLCQINDFLLETYPNLFFTILNIDINNEHINYKNIINLNIDYNLEFSDNSEHHMDYFTKPYRDKITEILKKYLE